ncbi:ABC transporter ATP-binding protein [Sanguibacter sp. HDW7]|uniref:ABC transporter ATP-binding protein n=1 Tax=Sanguibacter sp. HDW7 TaxID=2714931 RepID=UPI00140CEA9C|nr:ABC transporter ATP-binding protein [Sanguibacter sp. HDW7]QIK82347.1 ABC transporter ATP-binding protein [Sanguibacter sp. HDW7]
MTTTAPSAARRDAGPAAGPAAGLAVRDVVVTYAPDARGATAVRAVDGVSLEVARGEILALLGPSGCGKSSLLRAVAGLEPLAAGVVTWDDDDLARTPVHERGFGLMFQDGQLFAHRDVAGNVAYGLQGRTVVDGRRTPRPGRAERADRVAELLDVVGLAGYGRRAVSTLSGGERQRVALARSLAPRPRLLLLDEPLSALDRELRERLAVDLRSALLATGTTAVFVTHDQDEAFTVADRVAVMRAGRLAQVGKPAELWAAPASWEVASFLGYEAQIDVDGRRVALAPGALRVAEGPSGTSSVATPDARLSGTVRSTHVRRGVVEATVDVTGVGQVTVVVGPHEPAPAPGSVLDLRLDPARTAPLPG